MTKARELADFARGLPPNAIRLALLDDIAGEAIPVSADTILTGGRSSPGIGADQYRRSTELPGHPGKVQSQDGAWWEKSAPEVYVTQFGAEGDDITDQTDAIQKAIDYLWQNQGGKLLIPPGSYRATNVIMRPGVRLVGMGAGDFPLTSEKRVGTMLRPTTDAPNGSAVLIGDPALSGSRFAGGGLTDIALVGLAAVSERPTVAGGLNDINGLDFSTMVEGTWLQQFILQNCFIYGFKKGAHLGQGSGVVRYVPMSGNRFWNNETGLRVESGHPNFGANEFRFNDIGCSSSGFVDVAFHGSKFNHNRIGLNGNLLRVALMGCMFWQNRELGVELNGENQMIGCLLRGSEDIDPTAGGTLVQVNQRNNMLIGNRFVGDHAGPAIKFTPAALSIQASNIVAHNTALINQGRFIEFDGDGTLAALHVEGNLVLISSIGDGAGGQFFHAPASSGSISSPGFMNNSIRCETVGQDHAPVTVLTSGGGNGPINTGNRVFASAVDVPGGFDFSGGTNAGGIHTGNQFRSSATGSFTGPTIIPGTLTSAVIKDNVGFRTENSGTATIAIGETSVEVTHGLDVTPLSFNISVTPSGLTGASKGFWVSNVTSTTFRLNIPSSNATNAGYIWQISAARLA